MLQLEAVYKSTWCSCGRTDRSPYSLSPKAVLLADHIIVIEDSPGQITQ